jgi:uncharacterized protein (DUF1800 family)
MTTQKNLAVAGAAVVAAGAVVALSNELHPNALGAIPTQQQAARFLTQTTFGVTDADITAVRTNGFAGWITQQMAMAPFKTREWMQQREATAIPGEVSLGGYFRESFWIGVITRPDQLRQRMQFALSQIFVVSTTNSTLDLDGAFGTGYFYELLAKNAFGNFRTLLEDVTLAPVMGIFLSYIMNEKENPASGQHPDENYAREIMQLFTIGTVQLNQDGSPKLVAGKTVPTYSHDDIAGLAKCFTGLSWFNEDPNNPGQANGFFSGPGDTYFAPMSYYSAHHSTSEKKFLGVTIPASTTVDAAGDVKKALDTLFNHPNVGPFIATKLIKQFVTSNPTPAYVSRVAAVFNNNGSGVRGDLAAVLRAILLDNEARDMVAAQSNPTYGLLREPVLRLSNWARTFSAQTKNGFYEIGDTSAPTSLGETVLQAPSVFNFWRPDYIAPHTNMAAQGLTLPEFQLVSELTTAAYINLMQETITTGIGLNLRNFQNNDVSSTYANEVAVAGDANALLDRLNLLLFYGQMSAGLRQTILNAVNAIAIPTDQTKVAAAKLNRAKLAVFLSMVSGEYLTQR